MKKCMQCGGSTKMKKMAKGGPINKPMTYAKPQTGGDNQKNFIYGMPTAGIGETDGKNGKMKKGGNVKSVKHSCPPGMVRSASGGCVAERKPGMAKGGMVKKQVGGPMTKPVAKGTPNTSRYVQSTPGGGYNEISAKQYATTPAGQRTGMQELNQAQYDASKSRINPMKAKKGGTMKKMAKGGSTFGMLSVKAGVDNNPKPTAADRIAGAKMAKKKMGGATKAKKK